jgi:hypothetical protein
MSDHKAYVRKSNIATVLLPPGRAMIPKAAMYVVLKPPALVNISKAIFYITSHVPGKVTVFKAKSDIVLFPPGKATIKRAVIYTILGIPGKVSICKALIYVILKQITGAYTTENFLVSGEFPFPSCMDNPNYIERMSSVNITQIPNEIKFKTARYTLKRRAFLTSVYNISVTLDDVKQADCKDMDDFYKLKQTSQFFHLLINDQYYSVRFTSYKSEPSDLRARYNVSFSATGIMEQPD